MTPILQDEERAEKSTGNPYDEGRVGSSEPFGPDTEERRDADGLTGEVLDQLLRTRHVEGQRLGRVRALEEARKNYSRIWDEAHDIGHQKGIAAANQAIVQLVSTPISHAIKSVLAAKGKSGSAAVKLECEAAAAQLAALYQQVTGSVPEGYVFPAAEAFQVVVDDDAR